MPILLSPHNPRYTTQFITTKSTLHELLHGIPTLSIEHVGSTSIPGLLAKPIIDIDIIVSPSSLAATRTALVAAGYKDLGEMGVEGRFAFREPGVGDEERKGKEFKENTYVCIEGCLSLRNHRDVKRVLLQDGGLRREYGECKRRLVEEIGDAEGGMDDYVRGKTGVLGEVLRKAGWSEEMLEVVRRVNE
ncbi:putative UPF0157 protein YqkA [Cadophora sp. MPI-SDFR-AT-0126]|nr:putative UPF0157 protein YqkA [Leotiomycetes sp. MPI-SDFR-AT-0126]